MSWKVAPIGRGGDLLYSQAGTPSLDLRFAENKTLTDYVTATPLVDHQRSMSGANPSPGTFVNSNGLIETAKVNLLTYSEEFDNGGGWVSTNASVNNSGTVVAPDGTLTTDALTENLTTNSLHSVNVLNAVLLNGVYTFSVYVKAATRTIVALNFSYANGVFSTSDTRAWFNLSNGTVGTVANALDATITPIGSNGWYRCTLVSNSYSGANRKCLIASSTADGSVTHNGSEADAMYIWGAQLEEGSTATTYIPTTSVPSAAPRFDHDPTTGESLGLLVEEARTNLVTDSASSGNWNLLGGGTTDISSTVCPDGSTNGTRITAVALNDGAQKTFSTPTSGNYIGSCYARTRTGVAVDVKVAISGITGPSVTLPADGTWTRVVGSLSNLGAGSKYVSVRSANADMDIDVWGLQVEAGDFPTSYIPTAGTTVTRAADSASIAGANFSSWYNQSEGSIFADFIYINSSSVHGYISTIGVSDGIFGNGDLRVFAYKKVDAAAAVDYQVSDRIVLSSLTLPWQSKSCYAYANVGGTNSWYSDGSLVGSATRTVGATSYNTLDIFKDSQMATGHISRLAYWPQRLPGATLQTITT